MAKTKKKQTAVAVTTKKEQVHPYFESLKKRAAKLAKKQGIIPIIIFVAGALAFYFDKHSSASLALLYLFANDGKLSGRMSGDVKMRNGRGRQFKVPSLVRNSYTTVARTTLASFSSMWNTLTDEQRASWNASSGTFVSDRFAQPVVVKGKALFVQLNCNLFYAGQSPILVAPFIAGVSGLTSLSVVADVSLNSIVLDFTPDPTLTGQTGLVFATALRNPGVYRPSQSLFRLIDIIPAGTGTGVDVRPGWGTKFGSLVAGQKIFIQVKMVANASGLESAITQAETIVVP